MTTQREEIGTIQHNEDHYAVTAIIDDARYHKLLIRLARQAVRANGLTAAMGNGAITVKLRKCEAEE